MSLQAKYAAVVARELRHHAVWQPGDPVRLGDYGLLDGGRFSVQGNITDDFEIAFETSRSRKQEFAFRSDGVSESKNEASGKQPGAVAELRVGFKRANSLYVSSPTAFTEQMKGISKVLSPLRERPEWRPEWLVVTRVYHAGPAIILLSNTDGADVKIHLGADGGAVSGDSGTDAGEQGSVALQLTGVHGPLFLGLHRVDKTIEDVAPKRRLASHIVVALALGLISASAVVTGVLVKAQDAEMLVATRPTMAPQDKVPESARPSKKRPKDDQGERANESTPTTGGVVAPASGFGGGVGETGQQQDASGVVIETPTAAKSATEASTPPAAVESPSPGWYLLVAAGFLAGVGLLVVGLRRRRPRVHEVDAAAAAEAAR